MGILIPISPKKSTWTSDVQVGKLSVLLVFVIFFLSATSASAATLSKPVNNLGLMYFYSLDEGSGLTATDRVNVNATGTISGATWVAGKKENALHFNNDGSYMTRACTTNCPTYPYSVSLWFNATTLGGLLFGLNNSFSNSVAFTGGTYLHVSGNSAYQRGVLASNFQTGRWYNLTVVYTSSTDMKAYVNGEDKTVTTDDWWSFQCANTFSIGSRNGGTCGSTLNFDGSIDELRIYNRALTPSDITNLYQLNFTKFNSSQNNKVTNGLVGLWSFNGPDMSGTTAYDRSGSGNNGTLNNTPARTPGALGQALDFFPNGADNNSRVNIGDPVSGALDFGTGDFTVSFFMRNRGYVSQGSSANIALSKKFNDAANTAGYYFTYSSANQLTFAVGDGSSSANITTSSSIADNSWHHYVGMRSGNTVNFFVDGTSIGTSTITGSTSNSDSLYIGSDNSDGNGNVRNANADIDDVRIYNRALPQNEITQLYNMSGSKINTSQNNIPGSTLQSGLVGLWSFNGPDMSGTTAYDRSGNANNGTLTNGPTRTIGKVGQALRTSKASSQYVSVTNDVLNTPTALSVSAWVLMTESSASTAYFIASNRTAGNNGWSAGIKNCSGTNPITCNLTFTIQGISEYETSDALLTGYPRQWNHVTFTWDGGNARFYVNGVQSATVSATGSMTTGSKMVIGALGPTLSPSDFFDGSLDEVRVYNRTLTANEVKQLYNLGK